MIKLKNLLSEDDFKSPNTPEHRILRNLKTELDSDYQSNFTMDNQTLMVSYRGKKVEIDIDKIGNHDYQYVFHDSSNGQMYDVGDVVRVEGDDTDVNEVLRLIFIGQIGENLTEQRSGIWDNTLGSNPELIQTMENNTALRSKNFPTNVRISIPKITKFMSAAYYLFWKKTNFNADQFDKNTFEAKFDGSGEAPMFKPTQDAKGTTLHLQPNGKLHWSGISGYTKWQFKEFRGTVYIYVS